MHNFSSQYLYFVCLSSRYYFLKFLGYPVEKFIILNAFLDTFTTTLKSNGMKSNSVELFIVIVYFWWVKLPFPNLYKKIALSTGSFTLGIKKIEQKHR